MRETFSPVFPRFTYSMLMLRLRLFLIRFVIRPRSALIAVSKQLLLFGESAASFKEGQSRAARPMLGLTRSEAGAEKLRGAGAGVLHGNT
jgi:hypothetical protein